MQSPDFLKELVAAGAILSPAEDSVEHFGQPASEVAALTDAAVIAPVDSMVRIVATGNDRAKFLHNFCTNNINELPVGHVCEAFFGNVQARILGHGYLVANDECHELWMLPGDEDAMLKHLHKYIITEDVTIESPPPAGVLMLAGQQAESVLSNVLDATFESDRAAQLGNVRLLMTTWNDAATVFISCPVDEAPALWQKFTEAGANPAGMQVVERHRIEEGFPRAGVDLGDGNLIPEADRDKKSISYTKGCYLGQEPIARIDAMGHVNKKLTRLKLTEVDHADDDASSPVVTSLSEIDGLPKLGLSVVPAKLLTGELKVRSPEGRTFAAETY